MTSECAPRLQHSLPIRAESDKKARVALGWVRLPCAKLVWMLTSATTGNHLRKCKEKASEGANMASKGLWSAVNVGTVSFCRGWVAGWANKDRICCRKNKRLSKKCVINTYTRVQNVATLHAPGWPTCLSRALGCWQSNREADAVMGWGGSVRVSQRSHGGLAKGMARYTCGWEARRGALEMGI